MTTAFEDWSRPPEYELLFLENDPPAPEVLAPLHPTRLDRSSDGGWIASFDEMEGCRVEVVRASDPSGDWETQTRLSMGLSPSERDQISQARSQWLIRIDPGRGPVLEKRKAAMWVLGVLFGAVKGTVGAYSLDSLRIWSVDAVMDELMTNAALDIDSLYCVHAVQGEEGSAWVHTHGLGALGGFDIDLINPSQQILDAASEIIRALAFMIMEQTVVIDEPQFVIAQPGRAISLVPAAEFDQHASPRHVAVRDMRDESHTLNRAIVCEPGGKKGLLGLGAARPEPSRFISRGNAEHMMVNFSKSSSDRMALRACQTFPLFVELLEEFASLGFPALAKIGCPVDSGEGDEHLWFEVHAANEHGLDATLANEPYGISGLHAGDRGRYPLHQLTEWRIQTPFGAIQPNFFSLIRHIRANRKQIEQMMREQGM